MVMVGSTFNKMEMATPFSIGCVSYMCIYAYIYICMRSGGPHPFSEEMVMTTETFQEMKVTDLIYLYLLLSFSVNINGERWIDEGQALPLSK